jgi:glutathione S-transferase
MAGLALYDNPTSSNALKARFLLAELGLPYERRTIPLTRPRPAAYVALNPLAGVPTLVDGDLTLSESHAILRYLARREGREDLYPPAPAEAARVDEFLDRFQATLRPALFRHERVALGYTPAGGLGSGTRDPERAARVAEEIRPQLELLDGLVGEGAVVLGRFTIADCALAPALNRTRHTGLELGPFRRLRALLESITARPSWAAAEPVV